MGLDPFLQELARRACLESTWNEAHLLGILSKVGPIGSGKGLEFLEIGVGDDAAVVVLQENRYSLCADLIAEKVHFDMEYFTPRDVGYKAIAVNISDLAAMGATPLFATVTISAPKDTNVAEIQSGITSACEEYGIVAVGGDLSDGASIVVSVSVVGGHFGRNPMLRSNLAAGDTIFVTGSLGGSAAGLRELKGSSGKASLSTRAKRHLHPLARIKEGIMLAEMKVMAAMDVSDGLAIDLWRMADASNCGFAVDNIPIQDGATLEDAISGGEDFELIFATNRPAEVVDAFKATGQREPIQIGIVRKDLEDREILGKRAHPLGYLH